MPYLKPVPSVANMNMRSVITLSFVALGGFVMATASAWAKRPAPHPVPSVIAACVEYSAPHDLVGFVVATDTISRRELWRVRIYNTSVNPALERDVQDVFIASLTLEHGALAVTNEKRDSYLLDLNSRRVTKRN